MGVVAALCAIAQPEAGHRRADQRMAVPQVVALAQAEDPLHLVGRPVSCAEEIGDHTPEGTAVGVAAHPTTSTS